VENERREVVNSQQDLAAAANSHFKKTFSDNNSSIIEEQLNLLKVFPRLALDGDNLRMGLSVTLHEIEVVLKACAKEKSLGPDGWMVEFFIGFWDLIGTEVLELVKESRMRGSIYGALNSTFIALIPKVSKTSSFDDYRPISLCNFL